MTRVLISNRLQRDFSMVPDALWRANLPFAAKGVACYLLSLRHGAMPYVAEMEAALGIGRDARRKAFSALEAFGFLAWKVERDSRRRIVAKTLELDPLAFDLAEERAARAPESQAYGAEAPENHRAPEKPAGGKPVLAEAETRRCGAGNSGDTFRERKERGRAGRAKGSFSSVGKGPDRTAAPSITADERHSPEVAEALQSYHRRALADPERAQIAAWLAAQGVTVPGGRTPEAKRQAVRSQPAEKKVSA